jgi:DUF1365 family protein
MKSGLYRGTIVHRRHAPIGHDFRYGLFMFYLDLGELDRVFRGRWLWSVERRNLASFRRADHFGSNGVTLESAVRDLVAEKNGARPQGPIRILTHLRYFGYCMNPVSFYYCFDAAGDKLEAIVAEITNTPWGERHCYVLDARAGANDRGLHCYRFEKTFHVSPFMGMNYFYDWRFGEPGEKLRVSMRNERREDAAGRCDFEVSMRLERRELSGPNLAGALLRQPFMTGSIIRRIYWQAFRLWRKGAPFHTHPKQTASKESPRP